MIEFPAAQDAGRISCQLGAARDCIGGCGSCGWNAREAQRRARLPLWRNEKGLWQKRVGSAKGAEDRA